MASGLANQAAAQEPMQVPTASAAEPSRAPDRFDIMAIDVTGVQALSDAEVESLIYPFLGPDGGGNAVESARQAIEKAYRDKGYQAASVVIPQQDTEQFQAGVIRIDVYEAPVGRIEVAGGKHHDTTQIASALPALQQGKALNLDALQIQIEAQNRFPDRTITPSFEPGTEAGTVDVKLQVDDKLPYHASAEVNNDNSPSTTRLRASASARYTNLWGLGHTISGTFLISPENTRETQAISGSYMAPIIGTPWTILVSGYTSNSNIAALGGTNVLGDGFQVGARAILRLPATKTYQTLSFGGDFKDFKQDFRAAGTSIATSPLRYLPLTAEYGIAGSIGRSNFNASLGVSAGFRAFKRNLCFNDIDVCVPADQFQNRTRFGRENFVRWNFGLDTTIALPSDLALATHFQAQLADGPLATNEQFAIGGLTNLRGYYQSEAVGDNGFVGGLELRAPPLEALLGDPFSEVRFYAFMDGGITHTLRAGPGEKATSKLIAVGGGARLQLFNTLTGEFIAGVPLVNGPTSRAGDLRSVFIVRAEF